MAANTHTYCSTMPSLETGHDKKRKKQASYLTKHLWDDEYRLACVAVSFAAGVRSDT